MPKNKKTCYINYMQSLSQNSVRYQTNRAHANTYKKPCEIKHVNFKKKQKTYKKPIVFLAFCFWAFCLSFALWVNIPGFLEPVYFRRIANKNLNFDVNEIYAPTLKYANNLNFMGQNILAGIPAKQKGKLLPIHSAGELIEIKNSVQDILEQYKNLHAGVFVYDYSSGKTLDINGEEIFPSASIIKIPVLLDLFNLSYNLEKEGMPAIDLNKKVVFKEVDRTEGSGNLQYKPANTSYSLDYLAKIMIRQSDNSATNMLIEEVGGINEINNSLRHFGFSKTQISNRLPDLEGTNTTTPKDIATMLYNLDNQKFLPAKYSSRIKEYMSKVENRTLIKSQLPNDVILMHKTGDIGKMLGDAGIILTPQGKKFIVAIMVKRPHNDYSARDLIQKVANTVYQNLK